ncbi:MAG: hypothetical protein H3C47_08215 [Candidatus Cloacimonetes bacterium]|nr:hypothetical protein [Candidatus Cloacimonadota bacterium]
MQIVFVLGLALILTQGFADSLPDRVYPATMRAENFLKIRGASVSWREKQLYLSFLVGELLAIPDSVFSPGDEIKLKRAARHITEILPMKDYPKDQPLPDSDVVITATWGFPNPPHLTLYLKYFPVENDLQNASALEKENFLRFFWTALIEVFTYTHPAFEMAYNNPMAEPKFRRLYSRFFLDIWKMAAREGVVLEGDGLQRLLTEKVAEYEIRFKEMIQEAGLGFWGNSRTLNQLLRILCQELGVGLVIPFEAKKL